MKRIYKTLHYISKTNMYLLVYFVIILLIKVPTDLLLKILNFKRTVICNMFYLDEIAILLVSLLIVMTLSKNKNIEISSPYEKYIH